MQSTVKEKLVLVAKAMFMAVCIAAFALAVVALFILAAAIYGHGAVPPGTPGNTVCQADLDKEACGRFEKLVRSQGHDLRVLEGTAFATAAQVKKHTFVAILKCVDARCNIVLVYVKYLNDKFVSLKLVPTGERQIPI